MHACTHRIHNGHLVAYRAELPKSQLKCSFRRGSGECIQGNHVFNRYGILDDILQVRCASSTIIL